VKSRWTRSSGRAAASSGDRRARPSTSNDAREPHATHQALDRAARHRDRLALQLAPHLPGPVHLLIRVVHALNIDAEGGIALRAGRASPRICGLGRVPMIRGRSDWQDGANRLDSVRLAVRIDELHH
jgi:hypothetical protein